MLLICSGYKELRDKTAKLVICKMRSSERVTEVDTYFQPSNLPVPRYNGSLLEGFTKNINILQLLLFWLTIGVVKPT
jgi:hypothetical protein